MMHDSPQDDPDDLNGLEFAVDEWRQLDAVPASWRAQLSAALRAESSPVRRGFWLHPMLAVAASLGFMLLGAAGTWAILDSDARDADARVSSSGPVQRSAAVGAESTESIAVQFAVVARHARRVSLVGDFNGWNASRTPLVLTRDGMTWTTLVPLSRGRHTYAFVIDGDVVADPTAPASADDDFGVPNSLMLVGSLR